MDTRPLILVGASGLTLSACLAGVPASAQVTLNFDAAYMVAASGSTEPVSEFELSGPPPWVYLDLPDGALTSFLVGIYTNWFREAEAAAQFTLSESLFAESDKYWFSPSEDVWALYRAVGDWRIDANHSLVELIIIYGGGVGRVWARGSATIPFTVSDSMASDFNHDTRIDADDLTVWSSGYATGTLADEGDADADGDVDGADFLLWQQQVGNAYLPAAGITAASVPEPAGALSGAMASFAIAWRRRGRRQAAGLRYLSVSSHS